MLDAEALAKSTAIIVKQHVAAVVAPLLRRIEELESRHPERGEKGEPGTRGEPGPEGEAGPEGQAGPPGERGPAGEKGEQGPAGEPGRDGKDAPTVSDEQVAAAVARYFEINPPLVGRDGASGEKGEKGEDGRDGIGLAGAMIDRLGNLILTLTNGEHKNLGPVLGKDGANGRDGAAGADGADGCDGANGRDGADGFGFEDMDLIEDERGVMLCFKRGAVVKEFPLPVVVDCGVWKERSYRKGSGVTWGGSFWIAQRDTEAKPDTQDSGWRLAVKRGRDGRDGRDGKVA